MDENKKPETTVNETQPEPTPELRELTAVRPQVLRVRTGVKAGPNRRKF